METEKTRQVERMAADRTDQQLQIWETLHKSRLMVSEEQELVVEEKKAVVQELLQELEDPERRKLCPRLVS